MPKTISTISIINYQCKLSIASLCPNERAKCERKKDGEISWTLPYEKREMESGEAHGPCPRENTYI
jgi:hypothetical protein